MKRWEQIYEEIKAINQEADQKKDPLTKEWQSIRSACTHPNLPKRELGEQYVDTCPDCGHVSYCYMI